MSRKIFAAGSVLSLLMATNALAVCGDVTGDGQKSATDALAILRSSVGQPVELTCAGEGPTNLRFYNDFSCVSGTSVSEARFNGFTFTADAGQTSVYQSVDRASIDTIEIDLCGSTYAFPGPLNLSPGRSFAFWMAILDPAVYQDGAIFVLYDDGVAATAAVGSESTDFPNAAAVVYGKAVRR